MKKVVQYPSLKSSLWPRVKKPKDIAYRYAMLIKSLCSSLQYIRIHHWTWEVVPVRQFVPSPLEWTLREMEFDEIICMQVLSTERVSYRQAGLPHEEE